MRNGISPRGGDPPAPPSRGASSAKGRESPVPPGTGWPDDPATAATPVADGPAAVVSLAATAGTLAELTARQSVCRGCPRLVDWRGGGAGQKRRGLSAGGGRGGAVPGGGAGPAAGRVGGPGPPRAGGS